MAGPKIPPELTADFEQALADKDLDGVLRAADALQQLGYSRRGEAWLRKGWEAFPEDARIAVRLLEMYLRYRSWDDFDAVAERALAAHPKSVDLHYTIGCGHETRSRFELAADSFGRAADLGRDEVEARLRQVRSLRMLNAIPAAQKALKRGIKQHPDEASFYAQLGYTHIQKDNPAEAAKWFEKALAREPDWQPYMDDLAGALMLCERWEDAARASIRSLEQRKKNERAWTVYAIAHNKLGHEEHAEQGYKNAIRSAKDPSRAQGNYGLFLAKQPGRMIEAIRVLKRAYKAHPDWAEVQEALERLLAQ
ncbi:MAG: tetratricopeptide repeat protein [Planctomycetota bacterium]|nr:tetratricopeptide repeat protein [Planctomycetota bacterium]